MNNKIIAALAVVIIVAAGCGSAVWYMSQSHQSEKSEVGGTGLEVFGNVDKDNDVDAKDADLLQKYLDTPTEGQAAAVVSLGLDLTYADVNGDGAVNTKDVAAIRAIDNGSYGEIRFLDGNGQVQSISTDIGRIGAEYFCNVELCMILGVVDKVVAVDYAPYQLKDFYFQDDSQRDSVMNMANMNSPDYPAVNDMNLDVLLSFSYSADLLKTKAEKLIGTDVIYLGFYQPNLLSAANSSYVHGILKTGYIFHKVDRAEDYVNWILQKIDYMNGISSSIPENEKPHVIMTNYQNSYFANADTKTLTLYNLNDPQGQACVLAGGHNVLQDIDSKAYQSGYSAKVQVDAVFNDDADIYVNYIFCYTVEYTYSGVKMSGIDHGYCTSDYTDFKNAWTNVNSRELVKAEVDSDHVHIDAGDLRNGASGGVLLAAYLAKAINPDKFTALDPVELHNEYVSEWLGVTGYDVVKDAVIIYPTVAVKSS